MTLNGLEWLYDVKIRFRQALCCRIDASFGAHCTKLNDDKLIYQRQKCRPMNQVYGNIRFMRIFVGVRLGGGVKRHWGLSTAGNFYRFRWLRLPKLHRYGKQYYMTICYPSSADNWLQDEWPWMTLSGYFMSKSVFGQHFSNQSVWMSKNNTALRFCGFCAMHDHLATLGRHAQLTRCFSAVAELLVIIFGTVRV